MRSRGNARCGIAADQAFYDALTLPNVLATPHLGYVSVANYQTYFAEAVEDIETFLAGTPVRVITTSGKARTGGQE